MSWQSPLHGSSEASRREFSRLRGHGHVSGETRFWGRDVLGNRAGWDDRLWEPFLKLQFWFEFASTYSYPAVMRIDKAAAARGVEIEWRPFLLGPLFHAQQGMKDSPFNVVPIKGSYMWRDVERICEKQNLPFRRPQRFPPKGLIQARV